MVSWGASICCKLIFFLSSECISSSNFLTPGWLALCKCMLLFFYIKVLFFDISRKLLNQNHMHTHTHTHNWDNVNKHIQIENCIQPKCIHEVSFVCRCILFDEWKTLTQKFLVWYIWYIFKMLQKLSMYYSKYNSLLAADANSNGRTKKTQHFAANGDMVEVVNVEILILKHANLEFKFSSD